MYKKNFHCIDFNSAYYKTLFSQTFTTYNNFSDDIWIRIISASCQNKLIYTSGHFNFFDNSSFTQ